MGINSAKEGFVPFFLSFSHAWQGQEAPFGTLLPQVVIVPQANGFGGLRNSLGFLLVYYSNVALARAYVLCTKLDT